jgi:RNA polymerase sigma-70 factor (ECF subfamily)
MTPDEPATAVLDRVKRGEIAALEEIYRAFGDRVYRLCRSILGDDHEAEDAAQEVFLRVFHKLGSFDGRSRLSTWIYRLTVNHCLNWRRRILRWPSFFGEDGGAFVDREHDGRREIERLEAKDEVDRLLRGLAAPQRTILALREILDLGYDEIAKVLDVPEGTVMSRLHRARAALEARAGTSGRVREPIPTNSTPRPREIAP